MKKRYLAAQKAQTPHARLLDMLIGGHNYAAQVQGDFAPESVAWWQLYQAGGNLTGPEDSEPTPEQLRTFIVESVLPFLLAGADTGAIKASEELLAEAESERQKRQQAKKKKSKRK